MRYEDQTIDQLLSRIASEDVTPAAGSVAAVTGAAGAALCEMACIHSIRRGGSPDADPALVDVRDELEVQRATLLELADSDSEAIDAWLAAVREGPAETEMKRAIGVPLAIAERCRDVLDHAVTVTESAAGSVVHDAHAGACLTNSALETSLFLVRVNLVELEDQSFTEETTRRTSEIERTAAAIVEKITADADLLK